MQTYNLYCLIYISFRDASCDDDELKNILEVAETNNRKNDITGILIHTDSRFLQYLEGSKKSLEDLFRKIKKDKRHSAISLRTFQPINQRVFPYWSMGFRNLDNVRPTTRVSTRVIRNFEEVISRGVSITNTRMRMLEFFLKAS